MSNVDAQSGHGLPAVAPALGENGGLHGLPRRHEKEHAPQRIVRDAGEPIMVVSRLGLRLLHFDKQIASARLFSGA